MKTLCILISALSLQLSFPLFAQESVHISDVMELNNTDWKGQLMYVNYSDNRKVYLEKNLSIQIEDNTLIMTSIFPYEPQANSRARIKFKKKGTYFGDEKIVRFKKLENGQFEMTTHYNTKDNDKKALQIKTYKLDDDQLSITSQIDYQDGTPLFVRNESNFKKVQL